MNPYLDRPSLGPIWIAELAEIRSLVERNASATDSKLRDRVNALYDLFYEKDAEIPHHIAVEFNRICRRFWIEPVFTTNTKFDLDMMDEWLTKVGPHYDKMNENQQNFVEDILVHFERRKRMDLTTKQWDWLEHISLRYTQESCFGFLDLEITSGVFKIKQGRRFNYSE